MHYAIKVTTILNAIWNRFGMQLAPCYSLCNVHVILTNFSIWFMNEKLFIIFDNLYLLFFSFFFHCCHLQNWFAWHRHLVKTIENGTREQKPWITSTCCKQKALKHRSTKMLARTKWHYRIGMTTSCSSGKHTIHGHTTYTFICRHHRNINTCYSCVCITYGWRVATSRPFGKYRPQRNRGFRCDTKINMKCKRKQTESKGNIGWVSGKWKRIHSEEEQNVTVCLCVALSIQSNRRRREKKTPVDFRPFNICVVKFICCSSIDFMFLKEEKTYCCYEAWSKNHWLTNNNLCIYFDLQGAEILCEQRVCYVRGQNVWPAGCSVHFQRFGRINVYQRLWLSVDRIQTLRANDISYHDMVRIWIDAGISVSHT